MAVDRTLSGGGEPATSAEDINPTDSQDLGTVPRAIYIGGAGDLAVVTLNGSSVKFIGLLAGTILPVRVKRVKSTGTTATALISLY
jgi:hypothetical protein